MADIRRWLKANRIDSVTWTFGLFPAAAAFAAFVTWASLIVRALRGEQAKEDWRVFVGTAAAMAAYALKAETQVRTMVELRGATADLRKLAALAGEEAKRRDQREADRARREEERQTRLILIAALTLAVAVVALIVSLVGT